MRQRLLSILVFAAVFAPISLGQEPKKDDSSKEKDGATSEKVNKYNEAYYIVDDVNAGMPKLEGEQPSLGTPLSAAENYLFACREGNFKRAAHSLNLSFLPEGERAERGPILAEQFYYVLNQKLWIDFDDLPDRPDGQIDREIGGNSSMIGKPRRSIRIGTINMEDRIAPVRLQRVKAKDNDPVWLFSPHTVEKIPILYDRFGPGWLDKAMPEWAKARLLWKVPAWEWATLVLAILIGLLLGFLTVRAIRFSSHKSPGEHMVYQRLMQELSMPIAVFVASLFVYLIKWSVLSLTGPVNNFVDPLLLVMVLGSIAWIVLRTLNFFTQYIIEHYVNDLDDDEAGAQQGLLTRLSVAKRLVTLAAVLLVIGVVLIQLNIFETVGYALVASAGFASIILGFAAQPVLGNLIAGLQIAITQPVRIGDSIVFEEQWGHVEEVTFAYMVLRTWDKRRLIVPLQYLISRPVENWTKTDSHMLKPIYLYVDYKTDVGKIRKKFEQLLKKSDNWDGETATVQVTGATDESMEVRALCSAKDPSTAWDLHCQLREELIQFVTTMGDGEFLPRQRLNVEQGQL